MDESDCTWLDQLLREISEKHTTLSHADDKSGINLMGKEKVSEDEAQKEAIHAMAS